MWISVDPISNYDPLNSENYLDGEHNGGIYNYANLNSYIYCYQNPIKLVDPNGKQVDAVDFIPVIGSGRDICRGFRDGDIFTCGIGLLGLIADVATFGSGSVITGGIKTGIKAGIKTTVKQELKQTVKTETKKNTQKSKVKTGDNTAITAFAVMMFISGCVFVLARRKRND